MALGFSASANAAEMADGAVEWPVAEGDVIELSELAELSGGHAVEIDVITEQTLKAINVGNSVNADSVINGDVTFGAGAFDGFDGIGNFVINTGNNNNLQSSLNVSIVLAP